MLRDARVGLRRADRVAGAAAPLRRRRLARAAHAGDHDPRLRRAVPRSVASPTPGQLDEAMRRTEQEAVRMARLVDDLLALARFDEGRPLERRPVDLTALVADAARDARAVDPAAPDHDQPRTARSSSPVTRTGCVRSSPTSSATRSSTRPRDAAGRARRGDRGSGEARITVTDHGPGMTPEVAARVTERFYRADPAARPRPGRERARDGDRRRRRRRPRRLDRRRQRASVRGTTVTITLPLAPDSDRELTS